MIIHKSLNFREEDRVNIANRLSPILHSVAGHLCIGFPFIQFYLFEGHFGIDTTMWIGRESKEGQMQTVGFVICCLLDPDSIKT